MSQHTPPNPAHPTPPPAHTMPPTTPPAGDTHAGKPADGTKDQTDPNAGPQEKAAEESKAKGPAPAPKAAPAPQDAPPPTYKDANGADVHVGDQVTVTGTVVSVSADDDRGGGNVSIDTEKPISPTTTEKQNFSLKTATVVGNGPAPGTADAKGGKATGGQATGSSTPGHQPTPPGGSTAPQHSSAPAGSAQAQADAARNPAAKPGDPWATEKAAGDPHPGAPADHRTAPAAQPHAQPGH